MANKPEIIFTVTTDLNYDQRMQRICTALADEGYRVKIIGRKKPDSEPLTKRNYRQKRISTVFKKSFLFYAEYNLRLFFYLLFQKCDAICSIDLDTILPGFLVSRLRKKTFIHDAHELFTEMPSLKKGSIQKKTWQSVERFVFPKIKHAYTESTAYKEVYEQKYPLKFDVIRNVPFYFKVQPSANRSDLLYVGALNHGRGLESVIDAIEYMDINLLLAGGGNALHSLRNKVENMALEKKVKFLGWVKPNDLKDLYGKAKIGINLLEPDNLHYRLSFPNKLFDYIMAELPQICMNFENYNNILGGETVGVQIDDLNTDTIAKAIKQLNENTNLYKTSLNGCKRLKEIHNWKNEKKKLISFYNSIEL